MADNSRLRSLANAAFHASPLDAGVRFPEGPVMVRNVPLQGPNNNQGRRQPPISENELNQNLDALYAEYNVLKPQCVAESARLFIDLNILNSVPIDYCIRYRDSVNHLINAETRCTEILQMIAGLNRMHKIPNNPATRIEFNSLKNDIARNKAALDYANNIIAIYKPININNFPMNGGKKKRKAKRKTKRRA